MSYKFKIYELRLLFYRYSNKALSACYQSCLLALQYAFDRLCVFLNNHSYYFNVVLLIKVSDVQGIRYDFAFLWQGSVFLGP